MRHVLARGFRRGPGRVERRRLVAARLDVGELELLPEDLGELFERHVDFERVLTRVLAGLALTRFLAGFALAWTVGLVVPGAPGGLGVFEAVLLLRLSVALPEAPLLAVALSYRLTSTAADLLGAWVAGLDERLRLAADRRSGNGPISPGPDPSRASQ